MWQPYTENISIKKDSKGNNNKTNIGEVNHTTGELRVVLQRLFPALHQLHGKSTLSDSHYKQILEMKNNSAVNAQILAVTQAASSALVTGHRSPASLLGEHAAQPS